MHMQYEPDGYQPPRSGMFLLYGCIAFLFLLFVLRFWYLQVLRGEEYARKADDNRSRVESLYTTRGLILDSRQRLLAENRPAYCVALIRDDCPDIPATMAQISQWTGVPLDQLTAKYEQDRRKVKSFEPHILVSDIPFHTLAAIEANLIHWPGVSVVVRQRRYYPQGPLFSHILGYVAEANEKEMEADEELALGDTVGKQGLEYTLEKQLRGAKGLQELEVDARGRQLTNKLHYRPKGGQNIVLSLDMDLQEAATKALGEESGSIVVMEPDTGKVLALLTQPAFDNNTFTTRLTHEEWNALRDDPRHPLMHRTIQSMYPPGSVWKLMMAGLILNEGIDPKETVYCSGSVQVGSHTFRCWKAGGHGRMDLMQSLVHSCDVYYYTMGERIGIDKIAAYARASGFGSRTGINLPNEQRGLVPDREWRRRRGETWQRGETLNVSIGQGATLVTPVQMASFVAALLNGGRIIKPSVLADGEPEELGKLPMTDEAREFILESMRRTVDSGTARRLKRSDAVMGGKTGTAQAVKIGDVRLKAHEMKREHRDHAWMASWGRKDEKTYVVVVMLEHGGSGSGAAGPVAKAVFDAIFESRSHLAGKSDGQAALLPEPLVPPMPLPGGRRS